MTVAEMIKKTRLDNNMTQEEYGSVFGITRQTVSSWENEKSMPDLQMLITICNTYKISLDTLLNENNEYVYKISSLQKVGKAMKKLFYALSFLLGIFLIMVVVWHFKAEEKNSSFALRAQEQGFSLEKGHYILENSGVLYELPNQKLPFMKSDFYAQNITATYETEDFCCKIILIRDTKKYVFTIDYGIGSDISGTVTENNHVEYDKFSNQDSKLMNRYKEEINFILQKMIEYYDAVYDM